MERENNRIAKRKKINKWNSSSSSIYAKERKKDKEEEKNQSYEEEENKVQLNFLVIIQQTKLEHWKRIDSTKRR
jgi:hypothetical protein